MEKTLRARCPACGKSFRAPQSLAGAMGRCGGCRQDFILEDEALPNPPIIQRARSKDSRGFVLIALLVLTWIVVKSLRFLAGP